MYVDRNIIVDCHKTTGSWINFLLVTCRVQKYSRGRLSRLSCRSTRVQRGQVPSITPSTPSTILSVIPRYSQPYDSTRADGGTARYLLDFFHDKIARERRRVGGTGGTYRYLSIPSERLVIRERNVWYPPFRLRTLSHPEETEE